MSADARVLTYLDYLCPIVIVVYFLFATTYSLCTLQKARKSARIKKLKVVALSILLLAITTHIGQGILYLARALAQRGWWAPEHTIIHILASVLIWTCFFIYLLGLENPIWHPYLGTWILGLTFETMLCALSSARLSSRSAYTKVSFSLSLLRILSFAALTIIGGILTISAEEKPADEEHQPLLIGQENGTPKPTTASYGSVSPESVGEAADDEEGEGGKVDKDKELKERQQKRLEDQGGWWGYLKEFAIFLPHVWPSGNYRLQFCIFLMVLNLVVKRFLNVLTPQQVGILTDKLTENAGRGIFPWKELLIWVGLRYLGSGAGITTVLNDISQVFVQNYARTRISDMAFKHVMALSMDFHSNKDSGEVIRSMEQAQSLTDLLELVLIEISPVMIDLIVAMAFITHLFDAYVGFVVVVVGVAYTWLGIKLTSWVRPKRQLHREKDRAENKTIFESVSNWQTVAYFNRSPFERTRYGTAVKEAVDAQNSYYVTATLSWAGQSLIVSLGLITASFLAVYQVCFGNKPVGNFVTLVLIWGNLMYPLYTVANSYRRVSVALVDAERLLQLLQTPPTVQDAAAALDLEVKQGRVQFEDVSFSYDDRKQTLKNITFTAEPGQTVAFVGETGGGKSTTLKMMFRFYDVSSGSIKIDGQDIRDVTLESLREELGVVPQDPSLFNQTIMENVRYAKLDATDEQIEEACKAAAVHDKILSFPDGYKSKVGERGVKLSGGELQRVAIARVILKNPKIVLLDEATSAVDSSTEAEIQDAFGKLTAGRTTFVIAHRLSTIMHANMILVIDQGEIVERGTHDELLLKGGKYTELWTKQTEGKRSKAPSQAPSLAPPDLKGDQQEPLILINDVPEGTFSNELRKAMTAEEEAQKESSAETQDATPSSAADAESSTVEGGNSPPK